MKKLLTLIIFFAGAFIIMTNAAEPMHTHEFSDKNGNRMVRTVTPDEGYNQGSLDRRLPVRNPQLLAQVVWCDRSHLNAIAENVAISPDGYNILAGWWLNNERFSAYVSTGLQWPYWQFTQAADWKMPVTASDERFSGTSNNFPVYIWNHDSPLYDDQYDFYSGFRPRGVVFSGDGNTLAMVAENGSEGILVIYDVSASDTVYTRTFALSSGLNGVDISSDASTVVISLYSSLLVYNVPDGDLLATLYNYSQNTAQVSGDGSLIAIGTFSATFYLYEWNGEEYEYRFVRPIQHDWVTAVAVSDDGSAAACGTLDFENSQIAGGKFVMWDGVTGDVLIEYDEYGDEVSSVDLSSDGQYAIVGSWGQYNGTFGDAVTCFIRDTDVPIFQLLDDTDEPGSVFDVAISNSGHYAVAGGKAVHAREFGNGGMVYSIKLNDPLDYDVAVSSIDEPGELVYPGESITPSATFINVGLNGTGFTTNCTITDFETDSVLYNSSYEIDFLGSFTTSSVFFVPDFTIPDDGRYNLTFSAQLDSDQDESNNVLSLVMRSWHDLKANSVISPFSEVTLNWPCTPIVSFTNLGSYYETVDINAVIYDSDETEVYSSVNTIYGLAPYATEEVMFENWFPETVGTYRVEFTADVPDDMFPDDNTIAVFFDVSQEMIYDDGQSDMSYWVGSYPNSVNRKFAQRFDPNLQTPFSITNFRFFQPANSYDGVFDYIGVTGGGNAIPDTNSYLEMIIDPSLPGPNNWASFPVDIPVEDYSMLWVVLHWADQTGNGPFMGSDNTGIIDQQSYWYANANGWNLITSCDWMVRMTLQQGTGVKSEYVAGLPSRIILANNYPNPFNSSTNITFGLPNPGNVAIEIYNSLGQKVKTLTDTQYDAGYHTLTWNGKTDRKDEAATGIYYCRLTCGDHRVSQKMMLIK